MANNFGIGQKVLPNPFQNSAAAHLTAKTPQNDTTLFHGYRSNFDINQQKEQYQHRMNQQYAQRPQFNRNPNQQNFRQNRTANGEINHSPPSSNWCDLCECNFKFPYQLEKHIGEHEKCWFDNCNFEGHSKLLKKHIEAQHQSELFQRIGKVETDEDIDKWREERRKRYPTKANIEARQLAQEERLKRGERIAEPNHRFGNVRDRKSAHQRSFARNPNESVKNETNHKKNDKKRRRTRNKNKNGKGAEVENDRKKTTNNKTETIGAQIVKVEAKNCIENTAQCLQGSSTGSKEKITPNSTGLAAIIGMYGTDSDSDGDNDGTAVAESSEKSCSVITSETLAVASEIIQNENKLNKITDNGSPENSNLKRTASYSDELVAKQQKIEMNVQNDDQPKDESVEHDVASDDEAPEEQPIQRQTGDNEMNVKEISGPTKTKPWANPQTIRDDRVPKQRTILDMTRRIRNQNTLLEKLLQKDIRHERNVLLQCVRYVVENDFFGIGEKADEQNNQIEHN